jgi:hypothetical protein
MDPLGLPAIAAKIVETLLTSIAKVGSEEGLAAIKRLRRSKTALDDHLSKTLNLCVVPDYLSWSARTDR